MKVFGSMLLLVGVGFLPLAVGLAEVPCRTITVSPTHYTQAGHDAPAYRQRVRVDVIEVAQINPAYTSSYSPDGYDSATQADLLAELRRLTLKVEQLRVQTSAAGPTGKQQQLETIAPPKAVGGKGGDGGAGVGLAVLNAKCASCHQAGHLTTDQRFTLLDVKGNLALLTDKQKLRLLTKVYSGQMPPPLNAGGIKPISDAEYAALVDLCQ